jgi:hypothetical protein
LKISYNITSKLSFEEYKPYYFFKNKPEKERKAAKMFYILVVDDLVYRVEIRFKGNNFCSPQFLLQKDEDPKNHPNFSKVIITNKTRFIKLKLPKKETS